MSRKIFEIDMGCSDAEWAELLEKLIAEAEAEEAQTAPPSGLVETA